MLWAHCLFKRHCWSTSLSDFESSVNNFRARGKMESRVTCTSAQSEGIEQAQRKSRGTPACEHMAMRVSWLQSVPTSHECVTQAISVLRLSERMEQASANLNARVRKPTATLGHIMLAGTLRACYSTHGNSAARARFAAATRGYGHWVRQFGHIMPRTATTCFS